MKIKNPKVGDIYFNPYAQDLWILKKLYDDETEKEEWYFSLVHEDLDEKVEYIDEFIKIANIYDLINEYVVDKEDD